MRTASSACSRVTSLGPGESLMRRFRYVQIRPSVAPPCNRDTLEATPRFSRIGCVVARERLRRMHRHCRQDALWHQPGPRVVGDRDYFVRRIGGTLEVDGMHHRVLAFAMAGAQRAEGVGLGAASF